MPDLLTFVVLSAVTYRIGRFLILDSLIDTYRDRLAIRLNNPEKLTPTRLQLLELMACPYCITVWVAAVVTAFWSLVVHGEWIGWAFPLVWLATATGSLVFWTVIDSE